MCHIAAQDPENKTKAAERAIFRAIGSEKAICFKCWTPARAEPPTHYWRHQKNCILAKRAPPDTPNFAPGHKTVFEVLGLDETARIETRLRVARLSAGPIIGGAPTPLPGEAKP